MQLILPLANHMRPWRQTRRLDRLRDGGRLPQLGKDPQLLARGCAKPSMLPFLQPVGECSNEQRLTEACRRRTIEPLTPERPEFRWGKSGQGLERLGADLRIHGDIDALLPQGKQVHTMMGNRAVPAFDAV